jgi:hypothetical protein
MKSLLLFGAIALSINVFAQSTVKIEAYNLEVMTEDLGDMNWEEANRAVAALGNGWRLPSKNELKLLFNNQNWVRKDIGRTGVLRNRTYYWTSTPKNNVYVWCQFCRYNNGYDNECNQEAQQKYTDHSVRAIRNGDETLKPPVTIGNIEVFPYNLGKMKWEDAKEACTFLGPFWRLPTKDELNLIYENRDKLGMGYLATEFPRSVDGIQNFWSCTEASKVPEGRAMTDGNVWEQQSFYQGRQIDSGMDNFEWVRAVRDVGAEETAAAEEKARMAEEKARIEANRWKVVQSGKTYNIIDEKRAGQARYKNGTFIGTIKLVKNKQDEFIIKTGKHVRIEAGMSFRGSVTSMLMPALIEHVKKINPGLNPSGDRDFKIIKAKGDEGQTIIFKVLN